MSIISAPCAERTLPRAIALSAVRQTLSRYHESAERLTTPITAERELKAKVFPPTENSFTLALAASRFFSSNSANVSSVSIASKVWEKTSEESRNYGEDFSQL